MKNKTNKKAVILGSGILLLSLTTGSVTAFGGPEYGNGAGCRGDEACRMERQAKMQKEGAERYETSQGRKWEYKIYGERKEGYEKLEKKEEFQKELDEIKNGQKYQLSDKEKEYISHMREEEKIARDVYTILYQKWELRPFGNIRESEQKHMDMMKILIDKYELKDSMVSDEVGKFGTKEFQDLYDSLVEKGLRSEVDAIRVGLTIEDLDIYDLDRYLNETENNDVRKIFEKLNQGSFHHTQAFKRQLDRYGENYEPQYVSKERWNEALNAPRKNDGDEYKEKDYGKYDGDNKYDGKERYGEKEVSFFRRIFNFLFGWI